MCSRLDRRFVYLDNHSSTPVDPRVIAVITEYLKENPANPANPYHPLARKAAEAVEAARGQVAALIGAEPEEIVFTSGATEANNLAILGTALATGTKEKRIVTSAIEHKSVLEPCRWLEGQGFEVVVVPVDSRGHVDLNRLTEAVDASVALVSIQLANNEIGTIQRFEEIASVVKTKGAALHCDAAQAVGKIPVDVNRLRVDFLSISAHKLYGPKGAGALYVRGGARKARLRPLFFGGAQEWHLRPGTLNVPAIVGFGEACKIAREEMPGEMNRVGSLRDRFEAALGASLRGLQINGDLHGRLPNNSSITFPNTDADSLLLNLPDIALSTGAACSAGTWAPSPVLLAIGLSRVEAFRTVRVGLGRLNTEADVEYAVERIVETVESLEKANIAL